MDANAKLEFAGVQKLSGNGQHLLNLAKRQNLKILNNSDICKGKITRQRMAKNKIFLEEDSDGIFKEDYHRRRY